MPDADLIIDSDVASGVTRSRQSGDPKSNARKPRNYAEALGQVFTDDGLARRMASRLGLAAVRTGARVLDPCVGPATFPRAIEAIGARGVHVDAFDVDPSMIAATEAWAGASGLLLMTQLSDYLGADRSDQYDFAILNPPYVRQEWIEKKPEYRELFLERYDLVVPGTSNLYVYFIAKVLADLKAGGQFACIVYDSWQTTQFGRWLCQLLDERCAWWRAEPAPPQPFESRMIDATILYAEKRVEGARNKATDRAIALSKVVDGLSPISTLFRTKRGLRLKQADFFLTELGAVERHAATPFVKKIGLIPGYAVPDQHPEAALLITKHGHGDKTTMVALEERLSRAQQDEKSNVSILTWRNERPEVWAQHAGAPKAPLLFNYYLRRRPRHIRNPDRVFSDNFYGLTPLMHGSPVAWLAALNSSATVLSLLENARNQGSGLAKLQLFEYRRSLTVDLDKWSPRDLRRIEQLGHRLITSIGPAIQTLDEIDDLIASVLSADALRPAALKEALAAADIKARRPKELTLALA